MVPIELRGQPYKEVKERAEHLLDSVGLKERTHHYPGQLSGGERQRTGLERAFIHQPALLFADETSGNLDDETRVQSEQQLFDLNDQQGTTPVIVTHDVKLAERC